jgi:hypothetical protein
MQFGSYMAYWFEKKVPMKTSSLQNDTGDLEIILIGSTPGKNAFLTRTGDPKTPLIFLYYSTPGTYPSFYHPFPLPLLPVMGEPLELSRTELTEQPPKRAYWVNQELCPSAPGCIPYWVTIEFFCYIVRSPDKTFVT